MQWCCLWCLGWWDDILDRCPICSIKRQENFPCVGSVPSALVGGALLSPAASTAGSDYTNET